MNIGATFFPFDNLNTCLFSLGCTRTPWSQLPISIHENLRLPPPNATPPRNKAVLKGIYEAHHHPLIGVPCKFPWSMDRWCCSGALQCPYWSAKHFRVGGWTNPIEKYWSKWESSPSRDENLKKYLKPPPSFSIDAFPVLKQLLILKNV